ncbi:MAG: SDR family oxidoreductase [Eubacteriales bacterium]
MGNVLISGANEGIGYSLALQLLKDGHCVHVLDINIDNIIKLKNEYPESINGYKCDVSKYDEVAKIVTKIRLPIDIAIHNACKCTFSRFMDTSTETYKEVFDVNYYGAINISKAVIPTIKEQRPCKIMFVSSGVAVMGFSNLSPYASSKSAIETLAKCLNLEYKDSGITFQIIHPPLTKTRSSSPLPIPKEFMQTPQEVGQGIAKRLHKKSFIICHSFAQSLQTKLIYLFSIKFGRLFSRLTDNYAK